MSYIFPKRKLQSGDILDPVDLNADIIPAAERYSGRINEHNVDSKIKGSLADTNPITPGAQDLVATDAYFKHYLAGKTVDLGRGAQVGGSHRTPYNRTDTADFDPGAYVVPSDFAWNKIDDMEITLTTGMSSLWIIGWLQYVWLEFTDDGHPPSGEDITLVDTVATFVGATNAARMQFALRIDGRVIESTITGKLSPFEMSFQPVKPIDERSTGSNIPFEEQATALGSVMLPIRVGTFEAVQPGTHTVELVARRIETTGTASSSSFGGSGFTVYYDDEDYVVVGNRRLFVLDMPLNPPASTTFDSADPGAFETEDTISAASLGTNKVDVVRDAYNDVKSGALARGSLNNNHLPSAVLSSVQHSIAPTSEFSVSAIYPGEANNTTITTVGGTEGWRLVDSGAVKLRTDVSLPGGFDVSSRTSLLIVMANVQLAGVSMIGGPTEKGTHYWGHLALGYQEAGGAPTIVSRTEATVCDHSAWITTASAEQVDVPLFWVKDFSTTPNSVNYDHIGVYCAASSSRGSGVPSLSFQNGNIIVIQLRV